MKLNLHEVEWDEKKITAFWNNLDTLIETGKRDSHSFALYGGGDDLLKLISKSINLRDLVVLDYGCGMGALTVKMAKAYNCKELWGCDLSDEAIRICADNCKEYDNFKGVFKVGNGATSNLKEHYFDVIIVPEVIEHMDDKAIDEMLDTIKFIAKPKATVVFSTQNRENLKDSIMLCPDCGCYFHKVQHVRAWSKESIVSFFQLRNIKVKKVYELNLIRSEWKRIKKICYRVYNSLFPLIKMMHKGKAYNLVVVCEITK